MPVPALLGLSALGGLITKVIEKVIDFAISKAGKKAAIILVSAAALFTAVKVLLSMVASVAQPLLQTLPQQALQWIGVFLPSNTGTCLSAIISLEIAVVTYSLTVKAINLQSKLVD